MCQGIKCMAGWVCTCMCVCQWKRREKYICSWSAHSVDVDVYTKSNRVDQSHTCGINAPSNDRWGWAGLGWDGPARSKTRPRSRYSVKYLSMMMSSIWDCVLDLSVLAWANARMSNPLITQSCDLYLRDPLRTPMHLTDTNFKRERALLGATTKREKNAKSYWSSEHFVCLFYLSCVSFVYVDRI